MKRTRRSTAVLPASTEAAPPSVQAADTTQLFTTDIYGTNGHLGADHSRLRGMVYFPQLDTRREITSYTRLELLRKSRFLYANYGIARRVVNGLARLIAGTGLTPQATTRDKAWNALAEREFTTRTDSPFVFDVGGRYNFAKSQQAVLRFRFRDGDAATVLTESETGNARFAFFEGHQIGNLKFPPPNFDQNQWIDGVRLDRMNRAIAYRFLGIDPQSYTDLPAENVMFFADYERAGQSRGLTVLSHAVNHLLDAAEITTYIKTGVKLANQYGYWVEYAAGTPGSSATAGGRVAGSTGNRTTVTTTQGNITLEKLYGAGAIPDLPPGAQLKFNGASHPHPNNLTLIDYLIRDISWGVGLSPEILWNISALGGANTRFVLADAQGWIEEMQAELVRLYCGRVWIYTLAKAMKTGRLPKCQDPEWWKHVWIPPPRLTVDFGRDGRLHLEQLKTGVITYSRLLGWQGQDFETHTNKWLDELAFIKEGLAARELTWSDLAAWRNSNVQPDTAAPGFSDPAATDPASASAFLAQLAKNPAAAAAYFAQLQAQPEAA
jgi:capsid protein